MFKIEDAWGESHQVQLGCPECDVTVFTPKQPDPIKALVLSSQWEFLHWRETGHSFVERKLHSYA